MRLPGASISVHTLLHPFIRHSIDAIASPQLSSYPGQTYRALPPAFECAFPTGKLPSLICLGILVTVELIQGFTHAVYSGIYSILTTHRCRYCLFFFFFFSYPAPPPYQSAEAITYIHPIDSTYQLPVSSIYN